MDQGNLLKNIAELNDKSRPRTTEGKGRKERLIEVHMFFMKVKN